MDETFNTVVIGGGQAGLAAGYFLAQQGDNFIILDENLRTGETWRKRWDSLRLFTPSQFDSLPGMRFPRPDFYFPTKDEVASYLEDYSSQFRLPVRHGVKVGALHRDGEDYQISAGENGFLAKNIIVATGPFRTPHRPTFASQLDPAILQLHASAYRNPAQVAVQNVLVVGAGTSGVEIALELSRAGKRVWMAGRDVGQIPADTLGRFFGGKPYWWLTSHLLSVDTPIGRKMKSRVLAHGNPLIRTRRQDVVAAGGECVPRISAVHSGKPQLEDGRTLPVEAVIWATGYRPDFKWIHLPVFDDHGYPRHVRGVVPGAPGLYFVGLHFQTALSSALLGGVGADARYITAQIIRDVLPDVHQIVKAGFLT